MTATDELRRLLDERGVEHGWADEHDDQTWWKDRDGNAYFAKGENCLMYFNLTPEQAIAATLGNDGVERSKNGVSELEAENAKLRDEFRKMDEWHSRELLAAVDENAKLRTLCKMFAEYVGADRCEGCVCKSRCNDGLLDECWMLTNLRKSALELGIEVDE